MFTFAKIRGQIGISYSDNHLVNNDYYCEKEKVQGVYTGKLSLEFNLDGKNVTSEEFNKFYNNINPNTEGKLTKAKFKSRVAGLDLTCSAPKSLSVLYRLGGDERLKSAHSKAVDKALIELEKSAYRRDRKGDNYHSEANINTGNLLITKYEHDTSRDLDPQIHTHCFVMNFTKDNNTGEFYALQNSEIIRNIDHFGRIYQNELAIEVQKLGYEIKITRDSKRNIKSFELKGVSDNLLDKFSKRAKTVKDVTKYFIEENGRKPTADELRIIKTQTREQKLTETTNSEILKNQKDQLSKSEDINLKSVYEKSLVREVLCENKLDLVNEKEAIKKALNHLTERKSVITVTELEKECLKENLGRINFDKLDIAIKESKQIIKIENDILTTREILSEEKEVIKFATRTKNKFQPLNDRYKPFSDSKTKYYEKNKGYDYTEQRIAVEKVLNNKDQITVFRGVAGAGKTTALSEIEKALKQNKLKSYYFAPTRTAVKELKGISERADTVASLIKKHEIGKLNDIKNSVLVIDEAGLLSTKQGKVITDIAKKYNCRIILSGDSKQHSGVERGDYLRILENYSKTETVELSTIRPEILYEKLNLYI
ncbi:MAG TPA: MobF family relaxase [Victivallales bacterium]|nr:MobF family relaxase [Victivallales bacterium]